MSRIFLFFLSLVLIVCALGCSSTERDLTTPEGLFESGQEFEKNERFEIAIQRYNEIRNKFPYSSYALRAELAVADVHFKQEDYAAAQISYQSFRELHPAHPQIDYVTFRIGLSYYNQLPETVDRDLTLAHDAIRIFDELLEKYPKSQHISEANEKRTAALQKLAGKEDYIGDFYFKRGLFDSALPRYENLLSRYSGQGFDEKALARAAISAHKTDKKDKARRFLSILRERFPGSEGLEEARRVIE